MPVLTLGTGAPAAVTVLSVGFTVTARAVDSTLFEGIPSTVFTLSNGTHTQNDTSDASGNLSYENVPAGSNYTFTSANWVYTGSPFTISGAGDLGDRTFDFMA